MVFTILGHTQMLHFQITSTHRENAPGSNGTFSAESTLGGCATSNPAGGSNQNNFACNVGTVNQSLTPQFSADDAVIAGGKIFVVANTVNLNGLIQSGIAEKSVTINQLDGLSDTALMNRFGDQIDTNGNGLLDAAEWTDSDGDNVFTLADLSGQGSFTLIQEADNGTFSGSGYDREVRGLFDAYYDSDDDSVIISGFEAKGGEVFIGGKLISTGYGQINVLDGYASMNVNNQSGKDLKITGIETGEVEGKITLIDNFKVDTNNVSKVTRYTRIGDDIVVEEGYGRPDNDVSSSYTTYAYNGEADRRTYYNPESGARYFWLNGEEVTQTNTWNYRKKTVGFFGWNFYNSSSFSPGSTILQPHKCLLNSLIKLTGQLLKHQFQMITACQHDLSRPAIK